MYAIKSIKDNLAAISKLKKANEALDLQLHDLAMNALHYANDPMIQDSTVAQNLVDALGRSQRKNTLIAWFKHFGKLTTTKVDGKVILKITKKNAEYINNNLDKVMADADAMPFYMAIEQEEKPDAFVTLDIKAELTKLLAKIDKLAKDDKNQFENFELVADLRDLIIEE